MAWRSTFTAAAKRFVSIARSVAQVLGGAGNDLLRGEVGKDIALGGDGNDNVDGGATNGDTVSGGAGRNVVRGLRSEINEAFTDSAA